MRDETLLIDRPLAFLGHRLNDFGIVSVLDLAVPSKLAEGTLVRVASQGLSKSRVREY